MHEARALFLSLPASARSDIRAAAKHNDPTDLRKLTRAVYPYVHTFADARGISIINPESRRLLGIALAHFNQGSQLTLRQIMTVSGVDLEVFVCFRRCVDCVACIKRSTVSDLYKGCLRVFKYLRTVACVSIVLAGCLSCEGCQMELANAITTKTLSISAISITPSVLNLTLQTPVQLRALATYTDGSTADITSVTKWENRTPTISTLDVHGILTCENPGDGQISASVQTISSTGSVNCSRPKIVSLRLSTAPTVVRSESPFQYQMLADYVDGSTRDVSANTTWTTDLSIASVSPSGLLLCNNTGSAAIVGSVAGMSVQAPFVCVLRSITPKPGFVEFAKTFDGPFASWMNVKTAYGAKGDGVSDDTTALQSALDSVAGRPAVLWIPQGKYLISRPLLIKSLQNVTILGEDPLTTGIVWDGPVGGTMLTLSGCSGFNVGRLTWDGQSSASVALEVTWDEKSDFYPTRNLIHDSRIVNVSTGIHTGWAGETTVDRVHFDKNTQAGISLGDWNAFNFNVVNSLFTDDVIGVTNNYGAGAFNVTNSVFVRSTTSDIVTGNTGAFSLRSNLSVDSFQFLQTGMTGAPANILIQGNTIYNPTSDPIASGTPGRLMILDNQFLNLKSNLHVLTSFCASPLEFLSLGNTYSVPQPFAGHLGSFTSLDEAINPVVSPLQWSVPTEVYIPPLSKRPVFDLQPGSSDSTIQSAISAAAVVGGIVHLPRGIYNISTTLEVPANSSIALLGDGALTSLTGTTVLQGPIVRSYGKDFQVEDIWLTSYSPSPTDAELELHVPDVPSTRVFCDECDIDNEMTAGIEVDGLDDAAVELRVAAFDSAGVSQSIHGGSARSQSQITLGAIGEYMTSSSQYQVDGGGHLLIEDGFHDAGQGGVQSTLTGDGSVTQEGGTIVSWAPRAMTVDNYKGRFTLLGVITNNFVYVGAGSSANAFIADVLQTSGGSPFQVVEPDAIVSGLFNSTTPYNAVPSDLPDTQVTPAYVEKMMSMARTENLSPRYPSTFGSSTVSMSRIVVDRGGVGIRLMDSASPRSLGSYLIKAVDETPTSATPGCAVGEISMAGVWKLQDGGDGFLGLANNGSILSEDVVGHGSGNATALVSHMSSSRDRWIVQTIGDGSVKIMNRATGNVLTVAPSGCAYASKDVGSAKQQWLVNGVS